MIPQGIPNAAPMGVASMSPEELTALLTDPRTPPGTRAAAMRALQMRSPARVMPTTGTPQSPAAIPPQSTPTGQQPADGMGVDVMGALQQGAAMADRMRGMAKGGAVRGYDDGGSVDDDPTDSLDISDLAANPSSGGLSSMDPRFVGMVRAMMNQRDTPTREDKGLALAAAGFGMAASPSPHLGQAIGQGGLAGIKQLDLLRQQRAIQSMKAMALQNSLINAASLANYRGIRGSVAQNTLNLTNAARLTPAQLTDMADTIKKTGDLSVISKLGAGPAATANKSDLVRILAIDSPDLAKAALSFAESKGEASAFGRGQGERAAGTFKINLGAGESTPAPVAPLSIPTKPTGVAPGVGTSPAAAAAPSAPVVSPAAPAAAPIPVPKPTTSLIPRAIPFTQPTNTAEKSQFDALAKKLGDRAEEIDTAGSTALDANYLLNQMRDENQTWDMGKMQPTLKSAQSYLLGFNNLLPESMKVDADEMGKSVGDFQAFNKNAMELARQTVRATSSRAAYQEMQMIQKALPSPEMTQQGFDRIAAQLQGANDFRLAQQQMKDSWMRENNNNLNGFDTWFNKSFNPAVFMIHRLTPDDRETVMSEIAKTPNGRASLAKLRDQNDYANKLGLFEVVQ